MFQAKAHFCKLAKNINLSYNEIEKAFRIDE